MSLRASSKLYTHTVTTVINEWLCGNKRRLRILLGVVASTQHIADQIGLAGPEGQLVDALLSFWISKDVITSCK